MEVTPLPGAAVSGTALRDASHARAADSDGWTTHALEEELRGSSHGGRWQGVEYPINLNEKDQWMLMV